MFCKNRYTSKIDVLQNTNSARNTIISPKFPGVEILLKGTVYAEFRANRPASKFPHQKIR